MGREQMIRTLANELGWDVDDCDPTDVLDAFDRLGWFVGTPTDRSEIDDLRLIADTAMQMERGLGHNRDAFLAALRRQRGPRFGPDARRVALYGTQDPQNNVLPASEPSDVATTPNTPGDEQ